jgi:hypothetical protein
MNANERSEKRVMASDPTPGVHALQPDTTGHAARTQIRRRVFLLLIILAAFGLRLFRLDGQSLWYDEGVTATIAQFGLADLTRWTAADIQPPLYYTLVAAWGRLAGWSEWSLRFVSVWFGALLVPLMAVLAARLTRNGWAGLLTAFLTALHPLLVYYSQEARMYALLTVLGVVAGYCVVRLGEGENRPVLWLGYIAAASAALYTHYFAVFLLLALAIAFAGDVIRARSSNLSRSHSPRLGRYISANLAVFLLYVPWLVVMLTQLREDSSYWQGAFKLGEALRKVAVSFTSGETVFETDGIWFLFFHVPITLFAVTRLWRARNQRRALRYGALWLLVPVFAVLLLALFIPKFNARYVMLALPGLLVLWGGGLVRRTESMRSRDWETDAHQSPNLPISQSLIPFFSILFLTTTFLYASFNWFTNPAFSKDDWRGVTEFLRPRLGEEEAIALISGHAWPVWDYYAPDLPAVRLPDLRILDVDAVLDFADTAQPLREALDPLSDRPGIWLIGWQDDVIDPTGVVPVQLTVAGKEKGLDTHYWGLSLRRFSQLKTHWIPETPPIAQPTEIQFGDHLILRGYGAIDNGDLLLFWQRTPGHSLTASDFVIGGEVFDAAGNQIGVLPNMPPAGFAYPAHRWPDARIAMGVIPAQAWLGTEPAPGAYRVELRVYDNAGSAPTALLTPDGADNVTLTPIKVVIE